MASIKNVNSYTDYFRQKAIADPDLQHDPASEDGDAPIGSMHFNTWSVEDIITGLNTQLGFPALLVEMFETTTHELSKMDIRGTRQGAFTVLAAPSIPQSQKARIEAYSQAEAIIWRIIQSMWEDHFGEHADSCTSQFGDLQFDNMQIMPVGPTGDNQFGWRCEFSFSISNLILP